MKHRATTKYGILAGAIALAVGSAMAQPERAPGGPAPGQVQPPSQQLPGQPPAAQPSTRSPQEPEAQAKAASSVDQISEQNKDLAKFVAAVKAAGLADALTSGTEYTVFAPTDEAWGDEQLGKDIDELMKPENRQELISLLRAHIVADDVDMEAASNLQQARTIDGGSVEIESDGSGEFQVGDARTVDEDLQVGNLRVYPIDGVLAAMRPQDSSRAPGNQPGSNAPGREPQAPAPSRPESGRSPSPAVPGPAPSPGAPR